MKMHEFITYVVDKVVKNGTPVSYVGRTLCVGPKPIDLWIREYGDYVDVPQSWKFYLYYAVEDRSNGPGCKGRWLRRLLTARLGPLVVGQPGPSGKRA